LAGLFDEIALILQNHKFRWWRPPPDGAEHTLRGASDLRKKWLYGS